MTRLILGALLCLVTPAVCVAQEPVGTVVGIVSDSSHAVIAGARVQLISRATRQVRTTATAHRGEYSFPAIQAGDYELRVEAVGFQRVTRGATIEAGAITRSDVILPVGDLTESVVVAVASPQIHYDSAAVSGLTTRDQIENLPLNGRGFLELAKLEPGVQPPAIVNRNRTIVPILGAPASNVGGARFTVDGGSITSVGLGGAQMGFSQEAVQEFQIATVNFDPPAAMTHGGIVNVVTRSGSNDAQSSAFLFFRDHTLAAYPALMRDPSNPDPFFRRHQFGFASGGPIRRNRMFYFGSWERNDQQAIAATTQLVPDFAHLSRVSASPLLNDLFSVRVDGRISEAHTAFARFSHDGSRAFGPASSISGGSPNADPSNWNRTSVRADQGLVGLTSIFGPTVVNDLRASYFFVRTGLAAPTERDCGGCLGLGAPSITVRGTGLTIGHSTATDNLERRFHVIDSIVWQRSAHRLRFGVDWEHNRDRNFIWSNEPVTLTLFSPDDVRAYNALPQTAPDRQVPLPAAFNTLSDLLQLPLQSFTLGIGDPGVPQEGGGTVRRWNTLWLHAQDMWRLRERVTLSFGLGWGFDGIVNHDLQKPALLAPLLGVDGLGPTRNAWTNFAPVLGGAWTPSSDAKTVVRAGVGRYYGAQGLTSSLDAERVALGPPGLGRQTFVGSSVLNPLPGIPGVAIDRPLDFRGFPTLFTGVNLLAILPVIRAGATELLASADSKVQAIQVSRQAASPTVIFPVNVENPSAVHVNVGVQREMAPGLVVSADLAYRKFVHVPQGGGAIDVNHFNSVRGPVIPACTTAQRADPYALCSLGPINVQRAPYRFSYKGLLLRADKRLSSGFQLLGSYAYSKNSGTNIGNGFNLDNWIQNAGPTANDVRHILNVAGVLQVPWRLALGFNFSYSSIPPFTAYLGGIDFNGDGTTGDLLPGTTVNGFNRGLDVVDLERLVRQFNGTYAGAKDAQGVVIPRLTLPSRYSLGDSFHALDVRLSRSFPLRSRLRVSLIAEAFNLYNTSNLSGYSGDLTSAAFGQPTSRVTQVFGSGGPRSFQLAARVSF